MNLTIETKLKYQEPGTGPFRRVVWWGGAAPLASKRFCFGLSREGYLQFEATEDAALPAVPTLMGVMPTVGMPPVGAVSVVRVHGDYAFVNSGTGVTVVDVSNETVLTMVSTLNAMNCVGLALSDDGTRLVLTGDRQYYNEAGVLSAVNCLYVVDVSVPASPALLGVLETTEFSFLGVAVSGSRAYAACATAGVKVVNFSNPAAPPFVENTYDTAGSANGVMVVGNYAYVADRAGGLVILNISNPGAPTLAGTHPTTTQALDVFVIGSLAYVAATSSVQIIDVSTPGAPASRGSIFTSANQVVVVNGVACVARNTTGLGLWNVSNPASPAYLNNLPPAGGPNPSTLGLCADPQDTSLIYCANSAAGLAMVRISPTLTKLASIAEWFSATKVAVRGDLMISAGTRLWNGGLNQSFGLRLLQDRAAPYAVGQFDTAAFTCNGVAIASSGLYAYVVSGAGGVKVIDISNVGVPALVGAGYNTPGFANDIVLAGNYAYVADGAAGLVILDVSTPAAPTLASAFDTPGNAKAVVVAGTKAYVADNTSLQIIDVTAPTAPVLLGSYPASSCLGVAVDGNTAYLAVATGMQILNVTDPADVQLLSTVAPPAGINPTTVGVAVEGTVACMATGSAGLRVVDVTNPAEPAVLADLVTAGSAQHVVMDDGWAYVATATTINTFYLG